MFRKILIAVDGSSCSERAGRVGLALASRLGSGVLVAHVLIIPSAYWGLIEPTESMKQHAREILKPWAALGHEMQLDIRTELVKGDETAESIVHLANLSSCDLIVLGTHGRRGLGRLLLGSVAERVSRLAKMPVMLVRGDGQVMPSTGVFARILAPIDGSLAGLAAFDLADQLAVLLGAELQILHVIPSVTTPLSEPWSSGAVALYNWQDTLKALSDEGETILESAKRQARAPKVRVDLLQSHTRHLAEVIVDYARDHQSDLIVMGTHGRSGLERLLLGSVAEGVSHQAPVPLLLVRPAQSDLEAGESPV